MARNGCRGLKSEVRGRITPIRVYPCSSVVGFGLRRSKEGRKRGRDQEMHEKWVRKGSRQAQLREFAVHIGSPGVPEARNAVFLAQMDAYGSRISAGKQEMVTKTGREMTFSLFSCLVAGFRGRADARRSLERPQSLIRVAPRLAVARSPGNAALLDCAEKLPVGRSRHPPWTVGGRRNVVPRCRVV